MKFRLPTLLFLTTIVALSVGWIIARQNCEQKRLRHEKELRDAVVGSVHAAYAKNTLDFANRISNSDNTADELVLDRLAGNVWSLWKNESAVNTALGLEPNAPKARELAERLLKSMDCRTVDNYFSKVQSTKDFSNYPQLFPEIFEPSSREFESLHRFVRGALGKAVAVKVNK